MKNTKMFGTIFLGLALILLAPVSVNAREHNGRKNTFHGKHETSIKKNARKRRPLKQLELVGTVVKYTENEKSFMGLVTADGKEYALVAFPQSGRNRLGPKTEKAPLQQKNSGKKPNAYRRIPNRPKDVVTKDTLKSAEGKTVKVTGFLLPIRKQNEHIAKRGQTVKKDASKEKKPYKHTKRPLHKGNQKRLPPQAKPRGMRPGTNNAPKLANGTLVVCTLSFVE